MIAVLSEPGIGCARHHRQDLGDGGVGDVALFAVQDVMRTVRARHRLRLHVGRIRSGFFFGQGECRQLLAADERREPFLLLFARAEEQERADADRVVRVGKDRSRRVARADFLQHFAVGHLGEAASAEFLWRRHSQDTGVREAVDHMARDVLCLINLGRVQIFIEELPHLRE